MTITQEDNLLIQSYITSSFLAELTKNRFLASDYFINLTLEDRSVKELLPIIGIDNQGTLLMSLYAMLVIPKQLISDKFPKEFDDLNKKIGTLKSSEQSTYKSDKIKIDYIRHIRNAVAHARVSFRPNQDVTFSDEDKVQTCTITIPLDKIGILMTDLQKIFILYYNSITKT